MNSKFTICIGMAVFLLASSCSTLQNKPIEKGTDLRKPASDCDTFNSESAAEKSDEIYKRHMDSAASFLETTLSEQSKSDLLSGGDSTFKYVSSFAGGYLHGAEIDVKALAATAKYFAPSIGSSLGYPVLKPTITRACDFFPTPRTKMVHAIGTLASARFLVYPKMKSLNNQNQVVGEVTNPWTGLLSPSGNPEGAPMWLRFSIANPVAHSLWIGDKSLLLEFIPGLGLKFLVDGQKSVDLIAMESLAGQGKEHNYFKYEFSPDFSGHAPARFNTSSASEEAQMSERYSVNLLNKEVMSGVGDRFFDVLKMPGILPASIDANKIDLHSNVGPNPFIISIQKLATFESNGHVVNQPKRPWRLVFIPALDNIDGGRLAQITDPSQKVIDKIETDFRYKLAHLKAGDRVYYVVGETENGNRFRLGEIVLNATPLPSDFEDQDFFIQHDLELNRLPGNTGSISEP